MEVAQLVANRTTVCDASSFSQKQKAACRDRASMRLFSRITKIWFVGESR